MRNDNPAAQGNWEITEKTVKELQKDHLENQRNNALNSLDFEKPIIELEENIQQLTLTGSDSPVNVAEQVRDLQEKKDKLTRKIFKSLNAWDIVKLARHPLRPHAVDYIQRICEDFDELHGDRVFGDDAAVVGGIATIDSQPVMIISQEKGRAINDKSHRNFGMLKAEGYRKAKRLMELAERFSLPIVCLIDTPGAYPGEQAEERGISEAIATNLAMMSSLKTPIICVVIGEASSGGALGIGVGDHLAMMEYTTYFVISPEGCAKIIWKKVEQAKDAASAMGLTVDSLQKLTIVDSSIPEPLGGAHKNYDEAAANLKSHLCKQLDKLCRMPTDELLKQRYDRILSYGTD